MKPSFTLNRCLTIIAIPVVITAIGLLTPSSSIAQTPQNRTQTESNTKKPKPPRIDFAAAAKKLGMTEAKLKEALGVPATPPAEGTQNTQKRPPRIDFKAAAAKLGIPEQKLMEALGLLPAPPRIDFKAAAAKLKVTEAQLKAALGMPEKPPTQGDRTQDDRTQRPPRPDFKAAAIKLGITEQQLMDALGVPAKPPQPENPAM